MNDNHDDHMMTGAVILYSCWALSLMCVFLLAVAIAIVFLRD